MANTRYLCQSSINYPTSFLYSNVHINIAPQRHYSHPRRDVGIFKIPLSTIAFYNSSFSHLSRHFQVRSITLSSHHVWRTRFFFVHPFDPLSTHRRYVTSSRQQHQDFSTLTKFTVWIKRGICSADSLINIALCCLGYLPGLLHAWVRFLLLPKRTLRHQ